MFHLRFADDQVRLGRSAAALAYKRTATYRAAQRAARFRVALWALFTCAVLLGAILGSH